MAALFNRKVSRNNVDQSGINMPLPRVLMSVHRGSSTAAGGTELGGRTGPAPPTAARGHAEGRTVGRTGNVLAEPGLKGNMATISQDLKRV